MSLLTLREVTGGYGPITVLHGLSIEVDEGEVAVVLGANGAGRDHDAAGHLRDARQGRGGIFFDDRDITKSSTQSIARAGVALVPQGQGTFTDLTTEENLRIGAINRKDGGVGDDLERWYSVFPRLAERRNQMAGSMSGGEQQMLAIGRAMMSRPRLLLLDEPSLGLAPLITREVFDHLGEINKRVRSVDARRGAERHPGARHRPPGLRARDRDDRRRGRCRVPQADEGVRKAYLGF